MAAALAAPAISSFAAGENPLRRPPAALRRPRQKPPSQAESGAGEAKFTAVCAACHGADGNSGSPANPKLAQQHPEYLVKQLQEFKSGKRANAIMQGFASHAER
jgi:cytochrome c553